MRSYNKARATLWSGETGRLLRQYPESTRLLAIYLFTNERAMAEPWGLYYCQRATLMDALKATPAKVEDGLATLADLDYAYFDAKTEWLWVVNMAREQVLTDGKPLAARDNMSLAANKWYGRCSRNPFLGPFFDRYVTLLHLNERRDDGGEPAVLSMERQAPLLLEGPAALPKASVTSIATQRVGEFDLFWAAYHAKGKSSKTKTREEWMKRKPPALEVMAGLERWKTSQRWQDGYVVDAARWLKEERWLENPEQALAPGMSERTRDVVTALTSEGSIFDLERPAARALKEG